MTCLRTALGFGVTAMALGVAAPASAQFYLQSRDFTTVAPGDDTGPGGPAYADATPAEQKAFSSWHMRAALNVAALQCQFEPTLLTVNNYNAIIKDHQDELKGAFDTIGKYYARTTKTKKEGQNALDQFGTRTYSSFATVSAQYGFCQTAHSIGRDMIFAPRGAFGDVAVSRMRELRASLKPYGEQRFARYIGFDRATMPRLDVVCWSKKAEWVVKKCGAQNWPPLGATAVAATPAAAMPVATPVATGIAAR